MSEIELSNTDIQHAATTEQLLTVEDVARRLAAIHAEQHDDEAAHGMADDLYRDVLTAIANGAPDAGILAAAALRAETLDFARWCG